MEASEQTTDIVLWGATQAGKTTSLAAYLCHNQQQPEWLNRDAAETTETVTHLNRDYWLKLKRNRLPEATMKARPYTVKHRDGRLICFRDIKGGDAEDPTAEEIAALKQASGALLCVEWPSQSMVINDVAFGNARLYSNCPFVLVVTKVECHLNFDQYMEFGLNPVGVARKLQAPESFIRLLDSVLASVPTGAIFPVSVYGYTEDGRPALYLDEFGRLIPQNINPQGIVEPFDHVLAQIDRERRVI